MKTMFYATAAGVWIADYLSKWAVRSHMQLHEARELIPGCLRLSYIQNSGIAFGLWNDGHSPWKPYLLAALAVVAVVVILVYQSRVPAHRRRLRTALAITLGGIFGNFVDRIAQGYVVDFIELHAGNVFFWPTFNIADSAITAGIVLLLIDTMKHPEMAAEPELQE